MMNEPEPINEEPAISEKNITNFIVRDKKENDTVFPRK